MNFSQQSETLKIITYCAYCGEIIGNSKKYCNNCTTQKGRKEIFDETIKIWKENHEKLNRNLPTEIKNWK